MNPAIPLLIKRPPWHHQFLKNFGIATTVNLLIAVILTYLLHIGIDFYDNLVFSLCIGTLTWLFIDGGRLILWRTNRPKTFLFFLLCLASIPSARILGDLLAVRILGIEKNHQAIWEHEARFFIVSFMISLTIIWFFWNRGRLAYLRAQAEAEKARAAAIEKQAMQAQLQLLQAQIEPHMLFNTLANLQGLIAIDAPRAQHMLDQLIVYLRATLSSSRAEQTTLAQEFALMAAYLELMSVRMGTRLDYALHLPDALRDTRVPPMLLQPLVENAIKHGLEPKPDGGRIDVSAVEQQGLLMLSVVDTGLGPAAHEAATSGSGVGLANVRERLHALYGARASFGLTPNTPAGMIARLNFPL